MIPEITTILDMLIAGEISKDQATAWIYEHIKLSVENAARKETP